MNGMDSTTEKKVITQAEVTAIVYAAITKEVDEEITDKNKKDNLIDDLGADSLGLSEIIMQVEDDLGINITDDEGLELTTPQKAAVFAKKALKDGRSEKYTCH